jgi:hypothetical protein
MQDFNRCATDGADEPGAIQLIIARIWTVAQKGLRAAAENLPNASTRDFGCLADHTAVGLNGGPARPHHVSHHSLFILVFEDT